MSKYINRREKSVIEKVANIKLFFSFFITFLIVASIALGSYFIFDLGSINIREKVESYHSTINVVFYIYLAYLIFSRDVWIVIKLFAIAFIFFFNQSVMNEVYLWLVPFVFGIQVLALTLIVAYVLNLFIFFKLEKLELTWLTDLIRKREVEKKVKERGKKVKKIKDRKNFGKNK